MLLNDLPQPGHEEHLARLAGEHLVAAELCRRGMLATTFAGNLPGHHILAARNSGKSVPIQVKSILNGGYQIGDARSFVKIKFNGEHQKITGRVKLPRSNTLYVFVRLGNTSKDRFYICRARDVQYIIYC
jgi:hypothetical protein